MGLSQKTPTTFWQSSFEGIITYVANLPNPPKVVSISYGSSEQYIVNKLFSRFVLFYYLCFILSFQ